MGTPRGRKTGSRRARVALALTALLAAAAAAGCGGQAAGHVSDASDPVVTSVRGAGGCADDPVLDGRLADRPPVGPARGHVAAGVVTETWSLDDGALTVAPPPDGFALALPAVEAACQLITAVGPDNGPIGSGYLVLGTVTLRADVAAYANPMTEPRMAPVLPDPPAYQERVGWLLVSALELAYNCPAMAASASPAAPPTATPLRVVVVDATDGDDPLVYDSEHGTCPGSLPQPPRVGVPYHWVSVPWTERSRADDGTAVIQAAWADCDWYAMAGASADGYPATEAAAWADQDHPDHAAVVVAQRFGPPCGPERTHVLRLHPALRTAPLPAALVHDPEGLTVLH